MTKNPSWLLKSYPTGMPSPENWQLEELSIPVAGKGELLIKTLWLTVDPYMRG